MPAEEKRVAGGAQGATVAAGTPEVAVAGAGEPAAAGAQEATAAGAQEPTADRPHEAAVAGLVLAAGSSSRMGRNKLLFELAGETLLRRAVRAALGGGLSPVLVVLGHEAERARRELDGLECRAVVNPNYAQGIGSSLQAGVAAVDAIDGIAAALVLLADMPLVTAEMVVALVARYRTTAARLVVSDYQGVTAPPMLYDRSLFGELLAMPGGRCGKQVVKRHHEEAEVLIWPAAALADLDVPADYERLRAGAEAGTGTERVTGAGPAAAAPAAAGAQAVGPAPAGPAAAAPATAESHAADSAEAARPH